MLIYKISSICIECRDYDCYEEIVVKKDRPTCYQLVLCTLSSYKSNIILPCRMLLNYILKIFCSLIHINGKIYPCKTL